MFTATCIAAAGGFSAGLVIYANGIVSGWPGSEARRALVHFEAYTDNSAYVALVDGSDCNLNHDTNRALHEADHVARAFAAIDDARLEGLPYDVVHDHCGFTAFAMADRAHPTSFRLRVRRSRRTSITSLAATGPRRMTSSERTRTPGTPDGWR